MVGVSGFDLKRVDGRPQLEGDIWGHLEGDQLG